MRDQLRNDDINFDPHDPKLAESGVPFDTLAHIRERRTYRTSAGAWYLSRYDDVAAALTDVEGFRADLGPITGIPAGVEAIPPEQHYLSEILEPRHKAIRRLITASMSSARLATLEPRLRAECELLVDAMCAAPVADLHEGYAMAIPAFAMAHVMDLDEGAAAHFMAWSWDGTLLQRPSSPGVPPQGPSSHVFFADYLARQRALPRPSNDLLRLLIEAEVEGAPLGDAEIITQLHFLIQAGVHTTRSLLTHLYNRLVQDSALWSALKADRGLIDRFIEESLRRDAPVQRTTRRCMRDTSFAGVDMRRGEIVEAGIGSANHDERRYDDARAFRLDRDSPRTHLAFGTGSHICPGAALARLEARTSLEVLLDRVACMEPIAGVTYPPLPGSLGHQPVPARLVPCA
ncbi:cytochrome P450 [Sphingobium sp. OAS761]|uniref:cytochrome P450 n=1 Tax=Sphingobium sp. OAS761 TaxID=2817901 RepID=UPI00209EC3E5|nr:cytochrome P450 [Sphingobium sp. OAS761]MCP1470364.1 cytochrome P450 [Sphingobium sp. OAS761]